MCDLFPLKLHPMRNMGKRKQYFAGGTSRNIDGGSWKLLKASTSDVKTYIEGDSKTYLLTLANIEASVNGTSWTTVVAAGIPYVRDDWSDLLLYGFNNDISVWGCRYHNCFSTSTVQGWNFTIQLIIKQKHRTLSTWLKQFGNKIPTGTGWTNDEQSWVFFIKADPNKPMEVVWRSDGN